MTLETLTELQEKLAQGFDPEKMSGEQCSLLTEGLARLLDVDELVVEAATLSKAELAEKFNTAAHYSHRQAEAFNTLEEQKGTYDQDVVPECLHALNNSMACSDVLNRMAQSLNTRALMNSFKLRR